MASIQSVDLETAQEIEARSVVSGNVENGELFLIRVDGTSSAAGSFIPADATPKSEFLPGTQVTLSAFDGPAEEVILPEWYRPGDSNKKISDVLLAGNTNTQGGNISWSPDGKYLAFSKSASPWVQVFKRVGDKLTDLAVPAPSGAYSGSPTWTNDGKYLAIDNGPSIAIYKRSGDAFTRLPDIASGSSNITFYSAAWSPDGTYLAFVQDTWVSPTHTWKIRMYSRNGDVFTATADSSYQSLHLPYHLAWSPSGKYLSVSLSSGSSSGINLAMYELSGGVLVKSSVSIPMVPPDPGSGDATSRYISSTAWSPDGKYLAASGYNGVDPDKVWIYQINSGVFSLIGAPIGADSVSVAPVTWSPDGQYLALGSPLRIFRFTDSGGSIQIPNVSPMPINNTQSSLKFSPDGDLLAINGSSYGSATLPILTLYKSSGIVPLGPVSTIEIVN